MKSHYLHAFPVHREHHTKAQLGGDKSSQNSQSLEHDHLFVLETEQVVIEDLLKPLLFVLRYTLPFHNTIEYDPLMRCCVHVKGSFWRKICCVGWQLLILFRLGIAAIQNMSSEEFLAPPAEDRAGISMVAQIANVVFLVFGLLSFYMFWLKTTCMVDVLNCALQLVRRIHLHDASPPRSNVMKYLTHTSSIFVSCYVIMTCAMHTYQAFSSTPNSETQRQDDLNGNVKMSTIGHYRLDFTGFKVTNESAYFKGLVIVANFMNIAWWLLINIHSGAWGLFFSQLVKLFYWRIRAKHDLGHCIVIADEIRTFNKISVIVDKFNQIYGPIVLFGCVVIVTYVFLTVKHVFTGMFEMSSGLHLFLSYLPLIVGPTLLADLPRIAGMFAAIIKVEFGQFTKESSGDAAESLCGIAIVHYDLTASNFGFKGLGFFTVSYQFMTTTIGVIISYTILMAQLMPNENVRTLGQ